MTVTIQDEHLNFLERELAKHHAADPSGKNARFIERFLLGEYNKVAFEQVQFRHAADSYPSRPASSSSGFQGDYYQLDVAQLRQESYAFYEREAPEEAVKLVKGLLRSTIHEYTLAMLKEAPLRQYRAQAPYMYSPA